SQIGLWLPDSPLALPILELVRADYNAMKALTTLTTILAGIEDARAGLDSDGARDTEMLPQVILEQFVAVIEKCNPRLYGTWSDLHSALSRLGCPEELLLRLEDGRMRAFKKHQRIRDAQAVWPEEPALVGWRYARASS
ncbi:TPA: hypothetical protein ACOEA4_002382, partial [Stenotrophomonas maltophilia]